LTSACPENRGVDAHCFNRDMFSLMEVYFIEIRPSPVKATREMVGKIEEESRLPIVLEQQETKEKFGADLRVVKLIYVNKLPQIPGSTTQHTILCSHLGASADASRKNSRTLRQLAC